MFDDKTILVTGGTGSFGKNFVKFLVKNYKFKKLIIFSRDELKQSEMRKELNDDRIRFFLGDVRDLSRLQRAFYGVDIVIHAAALKQVPVLEYNPFEAIQTNIIGSRNVIEACIDQSVEKSLLISTDKAAEPVNLYGSTKLCAEKLFVNGNFYSAGTTKFCCVRYGNVLGSRGSIVESLLKNKDAKVVDITNDKMTRFWITLEQAFQVVLFGLQNIQGGEIFIPKIPSMKLVDLFDQIVPNAKKEIIGIRPGEKIHEILLTKSEARHSLELEKYFVILPEYETTEEIKVRFAKFLEQGKKLAEDFDYTSDTNQEWLTKEEFSKIIEQLTI